MNQQLKRLAEDLCHQMNACQVEKLLRIRKDKNRCDTSYGHREYWAGKEQAFYDAWQMVERMLIND